MKVAIQTVNGRFSGELVNRSDVTDEVVRMGVSLSGSGVIYLRDVWQDDVGQLAFVAINPVHVVSISPPVIPRTRTVTTSHPSSVG